MDWSELEVWKWDANETLQVPLFPVKSQNGTSLVNFGARKG